MNLKEKLSDDLKQAMKSGDTVKRNTLRLLMSAINNTEIAKKAELEDSDINIIVAGSKTGVVMVEGGSNIVSEADMLEAIFFGHNSMQPLIDLQTKLTETHGVPKREFSPPERDPNLADRLESEARPQMSRLSGWKDSREDADGAQYHRSDHCHLHGDDRFIHLTVKA